MTTPNNACYFDDEEGARLNASFGQEICINNACYLYNGSLSKGTDFSQKVEMTGSNNGCHWYDERGVRLTGHSGSPARLFRERAPMNIKYLWSFNFHTAC